MSSEFKDHLSDLEAGDHLHFVYRTDEERRENLARLLSEALSRNDRCLYVSGPEHVRSVSRDVEEGAPPRTSRIDGGGTLEILSLEEAVLRDGDPDLERFLGLVRERIGDLATPGLTLWLVADLWASAPEPELESLRSFEQELHRALREDPLVVVCQIDGRTSSDAFQAEMLRAHPMTLRGDQVLHNPFYLPPEAVLEERGTTRFEWMNRQLDEVVARQMELRRIRRETTSLLDGAPDLIMRLDRDLRALYVNQTWERITGRPAEERLGKTPQEVGYEGDEVHPWTDAFRRALDTGEPQEVEAAFGTPTGERFFHSRIMPERDENGDVGSLVLVARDVTEQRAAVRELEETLRLLKKTFASLDEAVFVVEGVDRTILDCNEAATRMFGYDREEMLGASTRILYEDDEQFLQFAREGSPVLQEGRVYRTRFSFSRRDGSLLRADATVTLLDPAAGPEGGVVSVLRDVTDQERLERQVLEISSEERSRIGRELHDQLGQQLTGLTFMTRNLHDEVVRAIAQVRHLARGLDLGDLQDLGLEEALGELASGSRRLFQLEVDLHVDPAIDESQLPEILGANLYRIAQEAVTNAARHGRARTVRIDLERIDGDVLLRVTDDGVGFDPASSSNRGMGLRTMMRRAEVLGGVMEIDSEPGRGTVLRCRLPLDRTYPSLRVGAP